MHSHAERGNESEQGSESVRLTTTLVVKCTCRTPALGSNIAVGVPPLRWYYL